jgi:phosphoenolpyruvate-protein phosphotransferase (PTS system enzyme I)
MTPPAPELRIAGTVASEGFARGPAARLRGGGSGAAREAGDPDAEAAALRAALAAAGTEIAGLAAGADKLGAEILEFQLALVEDEDLVAPVLEAVASGEAADAAWARVLDAEIADYAAAEDAYMAARAADLRDLRDRVLAMLRGGARPAAALPRGAVVLAEDLPPSLFLGLDWGHVGGAALAGGSPTSHVAILARARGVPLIVGAGGLEAVQDGEPVLLDAEAGTLTARPSVQAVLAFEARRAARRDGDAAAAQAARRPARTADGEAVRVLINVDHPAALEAIDPETCDGVGLTRTEFLFEHGAPDEAEQLAAYIRIVDWAKGRPVTIRTLDAGGDKPIPGVTVDGEANPFLGLRGLRLSLARPEPFRVQLRALARAAAAGPLKVMLPMVTAPEELEAARALLHAALAELAAEGVAHGRPELGIMVETPAAALRAAEFDAGFYSIGSNDLIQYVAAAARDNPAVAALARPDNPAVLELIGRTIAAGMSRGVEVSLCGDLASRPDFVQVLIRLGLRSFSVAPAQLGRIKQAIGEARAG